MKKLNTVMNETLYIGTGAELLPIYKSMARSAYERRSNLYPVFADSPKMAEDRYYSICLECDNTFYILNPEITVQDLLQHIH